MLCRGNLCNLEVGVLESWHTVLDVQMPCCATVNVYNIEVSLLSWIYSYCCVIPCVSRKITFVPSLCMVPLSKFVKHSSVMFLVPVLMFRSVQPGSQYVEVLTFRSRRSVPCCVFVNVYNMEDRVLNRTYSFCCMVSCVLRKNPSFFLDLMYGTF
jgi:hypothetical protein